MHLQKTRALSNSLQVVSGSQSMKWFFRPISTSSFNFLASLVCDWWGRSDRQKTWRNNLVWPGNFLASLVWDHKTVARQSVPQPWVSYVAKLQNHWPNERSELKALYWIGWRLWLVKEIASLLFCLYALLTVKYRVWHDLLEMRTKDVMSEQRWAMPEQRMRIFQIHQSSNIRKICSLYFTYYKRRKIYTSDVQKKTN